MDRNDDHHPSRPEFYDVPFLPLLSGFVPDSTGHQSDLGLHEIDDDEDMLVVPDNIMPQSHADVGLT